MHQQYKNLTNEITPKNISPHTFFSLLISCATEEVGLATNVSPSLENQSFSIAEDAIIGEFIGDIVADDDDGDALTFAIVAGNLGNVFSINPDTGALSVAFELDYETIAAYELRVEVSDGTTKSNATITINLIDVLETIAPVASDLAVTIEENTANATVVGTIIATDADSDVLEYAIISGNENEAFTINNSGDISVALEQFVDFETTPVFNLIVEVNDGENTTTANVTVNLIDLYELFLDGVNYVFRDGTINDYGNYDLFSESLTGFSHYNYDFIIVDDNLETITENGDTYFDCDDCSIAITAWLFSDNEESFAPGLFEILPNTQMNFDGVQGKNFIDEFFITVVPTDNTNGKSYGAVSGTIEIIENANLDYTLVYNLTIGEWDINEEIIPGTEQEISFTYSGGFNYTDERENANGKGFKKKNASSILHKKTPWQLS